MTRPANPRQKDFFDGLARRWDSVTRHDPAKVGEIADSLELSPSHRVLDVGTGTGVMVPFYERTVTQGGIVAIDYSENMIEVCREKFPAPKHPHTEFRVADLYGFDDPDGFDRIVCYSCFPHFPDQPEAISRLSRMLRPNGKLAVAHSSSRDTINRVHTEAGEEVCMDFLPPATETASMMTAAGLAVEKARDDAEMYLVIGRRAR